MAVKLSAYLAAKQAHDNRNKPTEIVCSHLDRTLLRSVASIALIKKTLVLPRLNLCIFLPDSFQPTNQPTNHSSIILFTHYLRLILIFSTTKIMLVLRPVRSHDAPVERISKEGTTTIILVLGIVIFLGLTYAIQKIHGEVGRQKRQR